MNVFARKRSKARKKGYGNGSETALFAGGFKGRCHNCGKYGHKSVDCNDKKDNSGGDSKKGTSNGNGSGSGFKGKCFKCNEYGHKACDCPKGKNNEMAEVALTAMEYEFVGQCFACNEEGHCKEKCSSHVIESESNGEIEPEKVALTTSEFGEDWSLTEIAEKETADSHEFGETSGPNGLLDDFFDDWSHFVPEDDDLSDEEFALVAFDKPVDNDPDAVVSKLEGTSEVVEDVGEDDASKCPSLVSKASSSDDDSSECPGLEQGKWRWGDDDSTDCNASYKEDGADDDTTESSNCPPPLMKRGSVQGSSVSSSEVEADDLDDDDDWAPWNKNGRDVRIDTLLMATDADESRDMIGECQGCGDLGIVGNFCAQCEDTGLIYEPRNNDESEKDGDEEEGFDWDAESKEYEFDESASSNSINHQSQLIQVKYVPKGFKSRTTRLAKR